jgi:UDP-N-acetylmuramoyl-L-alanyl-D-glutamate--2,6-diaminopimelate ligase
MSFAVAPRFDMSIETLFAGVATTGVAANIRVQDIKLDSREVEPGDLFVALAGEEVDGATFIDKAVVRGAVAVVVEADRSSEFADCAVPLIGVNNVRDRLGELADRFFLHPSQQLCVVGITGTNGKTSCCQYIAQSLQAANIPCGVIGTLGWGELGALQNTGNTTPDVISVHRMLAHFVAAKHQVVAMEVSSHGLDQQRVSGVRFDTAVFTNLSRDHLDYHQTMKSYAQSKRQLFEFPGLKHAVLNVDDTFGEQVYQQLRANQASDLQVLGFGFNPETETENKHATDVCGSHIQLSVDGIRARISSPWGEGILSSSLLGRFNLSNLLAVFSVLCLQGMSMDKALAVIASLSTAPGRMERYSGDGLPVVVVDYAHTPDALMVALAALREVSDQQLICVFGCGGDRDRGKRAQMGEVAERFSDQVIITNDNPRSEPEERIVEDILAGMTRPLSRRICKDRAAAIQMAVDMAAANDVVLVAGKGHENYQQVAGLRRAFCDAEQVKQALQFKARKLAAMGLGDQEGGP